MFRVQDNVPNVYINESRDFQTISRLLDVAVNSVRFDAKSLNSILNPFKANDRILELLSTRVGFFAKYTYDSRLMRYLLSAFPYILKNKGSKKGITEAISVILKVDGIVDTPQILIDNKNFVITIYTGTKIYNKTALLDALSYIIPIGYTYNIEELTRQSIDAIKIGTKDTLNILHNPSVSNSQVRGSDRLIHPFNLDERMEVDYVGAQITSEIIGSDNNSKLVTTKAGTEEAYVGGRNLIDADTDGFIKTKNQVSDPVDLVNIKEDISN